MLTPNFRQLVHQQFMDLYQAAAFFHVQPITVKRWITGHTVVNPMAEKLLNIKARGYLPLDIRWEGFRVHEERATLLTPDRREFSPKELENFALWRDEHRQLVKLYGRLKDPCPTPPVPNLPPFRGGRRVEPKPWVPEKFK
ncbi:phage protein [Vibrio brasiliensis]|uniref:S-adenosylhomocysteine hydrolase n=1 Tax=Vibrio brasiliensis LMG 20546 TaxID=945543 RepID=E8LW77_9VIBR|nr:phage protein [Vibrio brasiliensis]EGA64940.1 hypothetical protein VIBR0546_01461 [Vibrio brasiliensis LMG 20546]